MHDRRPAWKSFRSAAVLGLVALSALAGPLAPAPATAAPGGPVPGDVVRVGGLGIVVPRAGVGVAAEALLADGGSLELTVTTDPAGAVQVRSEALRTPAHGAMAPHSSPAACDDDAYALGAFHWSGPLSWYAKTSPLPDGLGADEVAAAFRRAVTNLRRADNTCGMGDHVGLGMPYAGITAATLAVRNDASCGTSDGLSAIGFGDLPTGYLGLTCTYFGSITGAATESDTRLNRTDYSWYTSKSSGCSNKFGIEAVTTHERGHSLGLEHVSQSSHGHLTMAPLVIACSDGENTLGLGDIRGLEALY